MQSNRGTGTLPERHLRSRLHSLGYRFRVNYRPLSDRRRTVDIAFTRLRLAVFMDGCFWHSCPDHRSVPAINQDFWTPKLTRTVERDKETDRMLREAGWSVLRLWEHVPLDEAVDLVTTAVGRRKIGVRQAAK